MLNIALIQKSAAFEFESRLCHERPGPSEYQAQATFTPNIQGLTSWILRTSPRKIQVILETDTLFETLHAEKYSEVSNQMAINQSA